MPTVSIAVSELKPNKCSRKLAQGLVHVYVFRNLTLSKICFTSEFQHLTLLIIKTVADARSSGVRMEAYVHVRRHLSDVSAAADAPFS
jgi:hypothetical protein